jgi:hypothetical protein
MPTYHSVDRWADLVSAVTQSRDDPRTIDAWARATAVSPATLRAWCRLAHLSPKRSLALARALRAARLAEREGCLPECLLDIKDPRTLRRFLDQSGLKGDLGSSPDPGRLLERQTFIDINQAIEALRRRVEVYPRVTVAAHRP